MTYNEFYTNNRMITSGVITGTGIGYVALYDCGDISGDSLYYTVKTLVEDSLVDGLIIDIRTNFGGSILTFMKAFYYLSYGDFPWMGWANRFNTTDRYSMDPSVGLPYIYGDTDDDPNFFDKKVALLVGPGAVSAGDMMQVMYAHHPSLKIIGKPTAGAFGSYRNIPMPYSNYFASRQNGDCYRAEDNTFFLSHRNFPIDSFVWFNRASICNNEDNVLTTAIKWIKPDLSIRNLSVAPSTIKIYPNPSSGYFNIQINAPAAGSGQLKLYNSLGAVVAGMPINLADGDNKFKLDLTGLRLPTGSYMLELRSEGIGTMVKKVTIVE